MQYPSEMKNEKIAHLYPLGTFSTFFCNCNVFCGVYNFYSTLDIKLKFQHSFLTCVEVIKCLKFRIPRYLGFKVAY